MPDLHHWLDKHIVEQAAHYGMTPAQHARLMGGAATYQEKIEMGEVKEPVKRNLCVDGHEHDDPQSNWSSDGEYPPFAVFDIDAQENLPGRYPSRYVAEGVMKAIEKGGVFVAVRALHETDPGDYTHPEWDLVAYLPDGRWQYSNDTWDTADGAEVALAGVEFTNPKTEDDLYELGFDKADPL